MLTSLVYLQKENVKKLKKLMKIVNIDEEDFHIFQTTFSGKLFLMIKVKVTKKHFTLSLENTVGKTTRGRLNLPLGLFRVKCSCN